MSDPATRYWKETPCIHGEESSHPVWVDGDLALDPSSFCSGPLRTLMTVREVDYEAAADLLVAVVAAICNNNLSYDEGARRVVDRALENLDSSVAKLIPGDS